MARRSRLDAELVRRGLARSREHAVALIAEGRVAIRGQAATKPATGVEAGTPVVVRTDPDQPSWVSWPPERPRSMYTRSTRPCFSTVRRTSSSTAGKAGSPVNPSKSWLLKRSHSVRSR